MNFTFLDVNQIFGDNKSEIMNIYGTKAAITDFLILLGGYVSDSFHVNNDNELKNRTGYWWTKTPYNSNCARAVS